MKCRFAFCLLCVSALLSLTECKKGNNTNLKDTETDTTGGASPMGYMPAVIGMKLTYTITQGDEKGQMEVITVTSVKDSAGYKAGTFKNDVAGIIITGSGWFNGKNTVIKNSTPGIYYNLMDSLRYTFNRAFTHQEAPFIITIPHQQQGGATVFNDITTGRFHGENYDEDTHDDLKEDYAVIIHKGTIDSVATISTPKGNIPNCVRVHYLMTSTLSWTITGDSGAFSGTNSNNLEEFIWFAPGLGMIESKEVNIKTGEVSVTELTGVE